MVHRLSWGVFVVLASIGLVASLGPIFKPHDLTAFRLMGHDPSALEAANARAFTEFLGRWVGITMLGVNALTLGIAVTALRRGERWAVWLMTYWPAMFLAHFALYEPGPMRTLQLVWLVLSTGALVSLAMRPRQAAPVAA